VIHFTVVFGLRGVSLRIDDVKGIFKDSRTREKKLCDNKMWKTKTWGRGIILKWILKLK